MSEKREPAIPSRLTGTETVLVAVVLVLGVASQITFSGCVGLFGRPFWLDEIYTYTLVSQPSLGRTLEGVVVGFDTNPPGYQLLLRPYTQLLGNHSETTLRSFALLSVLAALLGLYVNVRQAYSPRVAFMSALMVWTHPLVLMHAFEARYYGPWLAALVWFCYFLNRCRRPAAGFVPHALLAVSAVLVCGMHYFGIITLGLATAADLLARRSAGAFRWPLLTALAFGPLTLLACVPLLLKQRAAYTVPTWVSPASPEQVRRYLVALLTPVSLAALPVAAWLSRCWGPRPDAERDEAAAATATVALAGLTGLLLLPAVLVVVSYTVQPVLVDRYALPATAALAPVTAFLVYRLSWFWTVVLCLFLILSGAVTLRDQFIGYADRDGRTAALLAAVREETAGQPVLFESPLDLYVVVRYAPDLRARCFALDWEAGELGLVDDSRTFERDGVRNYARFESISGVRRWSEVRRSRSLYLVPKTHAERDDWTQCSERYPGFTARHIGYGVYQLRALEVGGLP